MTVAGIRADVVAGITVALVLVPQSMAYAQLAGLPVVYGLYASFIPVIIASLWGSSSQLHTGPVAMLSLMSAAALIPLANPGSPGFIELSIMLALMVGVLRLALGLLSLGAVVNLLSSPVIVGFTNAAALIIGLSQLSKVLGVPFPRTESYLADLWRVVRQVPDAHLPTLAFAIGAWLLIAGLRRYKPGLPGVLIAGLEHLDERYVKAVRYATKAPRRERPKMVLIADLVSDDEAAVAKAADAIVELANARDAEGFIATSPEARRRFWLDRARTAAISAHTNAFKINEDVVIPLERLDVYSAGIERINIEYSTRNKLDIVEAVLEFFSALGVAMVAVYVGFTLLGELRFGAHSDRGRLGVITGLNIDHGQRIAEELGDVDLRPDHGQPARALARQLDPPRRTGPQMRIVGNRADQR